MASLKLKENFSSLTDMLRDSVALTMEQLDMLIPKPAAVGRKSHAKMAATLGTRSLISEGSKRWKLGGSLGDAAVGEGAGAGAKGAGKGAGAAPSLGGHTQMSKFKVEFASASFHDENRDYTHIVTVLPMKNSEKVEIARMTAEAAVLAVWGSTCTVLSSDLRAAGMPTGSVDTITEFAVRTMGKSSTLGKVPESLAGCLCVLSKDPVIGPTLIQGPAVGSVQSLIRPSCDGVINGAGARAVASACMATLATPDDKERAGQQRKALLDSGTYAALLESVSAPMEGSGNDHLREQLEEAASLALMYLSCEGDARPAHEVGKILQQIASIENLAAGQYMAAGVWGLLRNAANRTAFMQPVREVIFAAGRMADIEAREKHVAKAADDAVEAAEKAAVAKDAAEAAAVHLTKSKTKMVDHHLGGKFYSFATDDDRMKYKGAADLAAEDLEEAHEHVEECVERAESLVVYAKEVAATPGHWEAEEAAHADAVQAWHAQCAAALAGGAKEDGDEREGEDTKRPLPPKPLSKREQQESGSGRDKTGLELLGETGVGWMRQFVSCGVNAENGADPPAQVAMEFLVAAIWLGMTTGTPAKPAAEVVWALSAPPGGASTWWKMSLLERPLFERADPTGLLSCDMPPSPAYLKLLLALAETPRWGPCTAARTRAFAAVWSLAAEDPSSQLTLIDMGFARSAADVAGAHTAPAGARGFAAGLMLQLVTRSAQGLADAGGWSRVEHVLISLASSGDDALVLQGCRAMAWEVYHREGANGVAAARSLAEKGAVSALLTALYRAHNSFRGGDPTRVSLDLHVAALRALLNLSIVSTNQEAIAKGHPGPGLLLLLRINLSFTELHVELAEHAPAIVRLSALLLQNLKTNANNRTVFYKAELRGTALREVELEAEAPGGSSNGNFNASMSMSSSSSAPSTRLPSSTTLSTTASSPAWSQGSGGAAAGLAPLDPSRRRIKASVNKPLTSKTSRMSADKFTEREHRSSAAASSHAGGGFSGVGASHPGKVRGEKQAVAASQEIFDVLREMSERTGPAGASPKELARRRKAEEKAAKVGAGTTEEFEAALDAANGGDRARHLPRLTKGLCRPLRDLWEQDVSLGIANPWSPQLEYVHPQKMMEMPETAQKLLSIKPPPSHGELRQELERHIHKALRLPAIESATTYAAVTAGAVTAAVGSGDDDSGGGRDAGSGEGAPASTSEAAAVEEVAAAEGGGDAAAHDVSTDGASSPTGESRDVLPPMPMIAREVSDVLTVKQGGARPGSVDSTIPTVVLPSVASFVPGGGRKGGKSKRGGAGGGSGGKGAAAAGGGGGGEEGQNGGGGTSAASSDNFMVSEGEPKGRRGGYPKFGSGVIKERGFHAPSPQTNHTKALRAAEGGFSKLGSPRGEAPEVGLYKLNAVDP
jgi:hypothetical protein